MGSKRPEATGSKGRRQESYVNQHQKQKGQEFFLPFCQLQLAFCAHLREAFAAENGAVRLGFKGNLCLATATGAGSGEEFTGATGSILASVTASLAALGVVLETALCVEFLLTGGEHIFVATLFAN